MLSQVTLVQYSAGKQKLNTGLCINLLMLLWQKQVYLQGVKDKFLAVYVHENVLPSAGLSSMNCKHSHGYIVSDWRLGFAMTLYIDIPR